VETLLTSMIANKITFGSCIAILRNLEYLSDQKIFIEFKLIWKL